MDTLTAILADIGKHHREVLDALMDLEHLAREARKEYWVTHPLTATVKALSYLPKLEAALSRLSKSEA